MITVEQCTNRQEWDSDVLDTAGHPLQLWGWGEVKARGNWRVERLYVRENEEVIGQCQLLFRSLPWPLGKLAYASRGPVAAMDKREVVLEALAAYVKNKHGATVLTVEPDWEVMPQMKGWRVSPNPILMARTLILDLSLSEGDLLSHMTKKTRQYIRKSEKEGLEIRQARNLEDIAACLAIYKETARRAGFALHKDDYYEDIFASLESHSQVFMAMHQGRVVAFLWLAASKDIAFELYGGMNDEGQQLRANYFLKWSVVQQMKGQGVRRYDMNGLLNDGVSKFKQGFADHETMLVGTYDRPLSPFYSVWAKGLPAAKKIVRLFKG